MDGKIALRYPHHALLPAVKQSRSCVGQAPACRLESRFALSSSCAAPRGEAIEKFDDWNIRACREPAERIGYRLPAEQDRAGAHLNASDGGIYLVPGIEPLDCGTTFWENVHAAQRKRIPSGAGA